MTPMPHPPYSSDLTWADFFFSFPWMKNVLKEKRFADVEGVKQTNKSSRITKQHQNQRVQKLSLSSGENISIGVLHQMESNLKVTEV